jgi:hypothetical protein
MFIALGHQFIKAVNHFFGKIVLKLPGIVNKGENGIPYFCFILKGISRDVRVN